MQTVSSGPSDQCLLPGTAQKGSKQAGFWGHWSSQLRQSSSPGEQACFLLVFETRARQSPWLARMVDSWSDTEPRCPGLDSGHRLRPAQAVILKEALSRRGQGCFSCLSPTRASLQTQNSQKERGTPYLHSCHKTRPYRASLSSKTSSSALHPRRAHTGQRGSCSTPCTSCRCLKEKCALTHQSTLDPPDSQMVRADTPRLTVSVTESLPVWGMC